MKNTVGNFTTQTDRLFPVDGQLFETLQANTALAAVIGNIAGNKVIVSGCSLNGDATTRADGYLFVRTKDYPDGEVIYFAGGPVASGMYVEKEAVSASGGGYDFPQAYTRRWMAAGVGAENYTWAEFTEIHTLMSLKYRLLEIDAAIAALAPPPIGVVQTWAGLLTSAALPSHYMMCDGSQLSTSSFPELYAAIGRQHTASTVASGYFCLPDLRGRFIAGYSASDLDYSMGKTGGSKRHLLTADELPAHVHEVDDCYRLENGTTGVSGSIGLSQVYDGSGSTDHNNSTLLYYTHDTKSSGGGASHENRPPYYTLAYIIRVK